jgi:hypothetical protein
MSRVATLVVGPVLAWSARREERRLAQGQTYEPQTIVERRNWAPPVLLPADEGVGSLTVQAETSGS